LWKATQAMKTSAINTPGTMAAINKVATDCSACTAYAISTIEGGKMGPSKDVAAVTPALNESGYLLARIARISTAPRPATSAVAEPDMPANIKLAKTFA